MSRFITRWFSRIALLGAALVLGACVITADGTYFTADDFSTPKAPTGDWTLDPAQGSEPGEEVMRMRMGPVANSLYRAQVLTSAGTIEPNEAPIDFGLVALGGSKFIVVNVEDDGDGKKSQFLGVDAQEDKLTFYIFAGGENKEAKLAFNAALMDSGLLVDPTKNYEVRLTGGVTKDKIKSLFDKLMADPAKYEALISVYVKK